MSGGTPISQLVQKIKNIFCTGKLSKRNDDGSIQIKTTYGRVIEATEAFPYGFITKAEVGAVTVLCAGGSLDAVKVFPVESIEDAPELTDGDTAIYSAGGSFIVCRNDGTIELNAKDSDASFIVCQKDGTIELNGKDSGGLIKVKELKKQLATMSARIDSIITAINSAVPVPQDGGAALKTSMATLLPSLVTPLPEVDDTTDPKSTEVAKVATGTEDFKDIESEEVLHGTG